MGLRRARGLGRAARLEPAQQPEPVDHAGDGAEPRRHRRQGHRRARVGLPAVRRGGDRRRVQRRPLSRSAARDPLGERQDLRPLAASTATSASAPPRASTTSSSTTRPRAPIVRSSRTRRPRRRRRSARRGAAGARPRGSRRHPGHEPAGRARGPARAGTTGGDGGLRRLRRFDDKRHQREDGAPRRGGRDGRGPARARSRRRARARARRPRPPTAKADPAARAVAERWFKAIAGGDIAAATALAALPFKTSGKDVTKRGTLSTMLNDLAGEEKPSRAPTIQLYTTAGLRAAIGKLPANVDDGSGGQLYALASQRAARRADPDPRPARRPVARRRPGPALAAPRSASVRYFFSAARPAPRGAG